jgi:uncharacterized protein
LVIAGSSGFLGAEISRYLASKGYNVVKLVRSNEEKGLFWNPSDNILDTNALEGAFVIINLSGANISAGRWDEKRKSLILKSRTEPTRLLAKSISEMRKKPNVFISASAVGYYGDRCDEVLDENSGPGEGFLSDVCREWERSSKNAGVRTVNLRMGVVLSGRGGFLKPLTPLFRYGLGARIGSGNQFMSWISMTDLKRIILQIIEDDKIEGPVNAVSPQPATNEKFSYALASALKRPCFFKVPGFVIKAALGEMGESLMLASTRTVPKKLLDSGFRFNHPSIIESLQFEFRKSTKII